MSVELSYMKWLLSALALSIYLSIISDLTLFYLSRNLEFGIGTRLQFPSSFSNFSHHLIVGLGAQSSATWRLSRARDGACQEYFIFVRRSADV
jgi:hypothetical protein